MRFLSLIFALIGITVRIFAADEYTFDLDRPPPYAKEWFAIAKQNLAVHESGQLERLGPEVGERTPRLDKKLTPQSNASCEAWAAYRFAQQQAYRAFLPNIAFFNRVRTTAKDKAEVAKLLYPWHYNGASHDPSSTVGVWALSPPSPAPDSNPEEVLKLRRYIVRLSAQTRRQMVEIHDPQYAKHFPLNRTPDPTRWPIFGPPEVVKPQKEEQVKEKAKLGPIWRDEQWNECMFCIHRDLGRTLEFMDSNLCSLFRSHVPGDKAFIKEMLIEAGFKAPEQRKAYWQFCRTHGANWANWKPEDEQRLVTD